MKPIYQTIIKAILRDCGIDADPEKVEKALILYRGRCFVPTGSPISIGDLGVNEFIKECEELGRSLESKST